MSGVCKNSTRKFQVGDKVRAIGHSCGWGYVSKGDEGVVVEIKEYGGGCYVDFEKQSHWAAKNCDLELIELAPLQVPVDTCTPPLCLVLGELESISDIVWGGKYQYEGDVWVCTCVDLYDTGVNCVFRNDADEMRLLPYSAIIKPVEPEPKPPYPMPKVGDLIRVTHEHALVDDDTVTEFEVPKVGYVTDVSDPAMCIKPALTMHDAVSGYDMYIMLPTWRLVISNP